MIKTTGLAIYMAKYSALWLAWRSGKWCDGICCQEPTVSPRLQDVNSAFWCAGSLRRWAVPSSIYWRISRVYWLWSTLSWIRRHLRKFSWILYHKEQFEKKADPSLHRANEVGTEALTRMPTSGFSCMLHNMEERIKCCDHRDQTSPYSADIWIAVYEHL